jgi:hypothetical protein
MDATRSFKRVNTRGGDASVTAILDGNRKHRARACEATTGIEPVCSKSVVPLVAHRGTSKQLRIAVAVATRVDSRVMCRQRRAVV